MISMDGFFLPEVPQDGMPDAHTDDGTGSALFDLDPALFDLDYDGVLETRVTHTDAGTTVATDVDGDGVSEKFTSVRRDGEYESWEIFREANGIGRLEMTDSGEL